MLTLTPLESRDVPAGDLDAYPFASQFYASHGADLDALTVVVDQPAAPEFRTVILPGAGGGPRLTVIDNWGTVTLDVMVPGFDAETYRGGLLGGGDGGDVVYVYPRSGPNGAVAVGIDVRTGAVVRPPVNLMAGDDDYRGEVGLYAGDLTGDGVAELVAWADTGDGRSRVVTLGMDGSVLGSFFTPARADRVGAGGPGLEVGRGKETGFALQFGEPDPVTGAVETVVYRYDGTTYP